MNCNSRAGDSPQMAASGPAQARGCPNTPILHDFGVSTPKTSHSTIKAICAPRLRGTDLDSMYHLLREIRTVGVHDACRLKIRDDPIPADWRGSAWESSLRFEGPYEPRLPIDAIVGETTPTNPESRGSRLDRIRGRAFHALYGKLATVPKARLLEGAPWPATYDLPQSLIADGPPIVSNILGAVGADRAVQRAEIHRADQDLLRDQLQACWEYEIGLFSSELRFHMNRGAVANTADLANHFPIESELDIDGSRIGLSDRVKADAFISRLPVMVELKTGPEDRVRHRLAVAGYALAYESQTTVEIDVGCVMYLTMRTIPVVPQIKCDVFPVDALLRQTFVEWRNQRKLEQIGAERHPPGAPR